MRSKTSHPAWLLKAAADPAVAAELWAGGRTAPLVIGRQWDLARIDFPLATAAICELKARGRHIGPYLMGGAERAMWWPVPLGTGYRLTGAPGVHVYPAGAELFVPPPGKYLGERAWVVQETGPALTSAGDLRQALDAAPYVT
ncbi:hypothetical protein AB0K09_27260 [Streptomyces sp. NPDC049577]|uniref:hypothetical protein n=1 Tax=Streptomyces sp. NPDC049577 TaxID=3155153 RepID=UPI00341770C5